MIKHFPSLLLLLFLSMLAGAQDLPVQFLHGAIVRGDISKKEMALVFTGDEHAEGGMHIASVLRELHVPGSFFLTGKFYRNPEFKELINSLISGGHYLGPHSDKHLLYCSWEDRDSLLVSRDSFMTDLLENYRAMKAFGLHMAEARFFLPSFEWYNDSIAAWTTSMGLQLINMSPGTLSHADYTLPGSKNYRASPEILESIFSHESGKEEGLNGFILLSHLGTQAERDDKFYLYLDELIVRLKKKAYNFRRIDELLELP